MYEIYDLFLQVILEMVKIMKTATVLPKVSHNTGKFSKIKTF